MIANDGKDVEPVEVDRLIVVSVSETHDVEVTIPASEAGTMATSEDRTKHTFSGWAAAKNMLQRPAKN